MQRETYLNVAWKLPCNDVVASDIWRDIVEIEQLQHRCWTNLDSLHNLYVQPGGCLILVMGPSGVAGFALLMIGQREVDIVRYGMHPSCNACVDEMLMDAISHSAERLQVKCSVVGTL